MPRPRRLKFRDPEEGCYHIICRALQKEYRFNEAEKQRYLSLLRWLSRVYFVRIATFSLMTTHVHLVIKMIRRSSISEEELRRRFDLYYNQFATEKTKRELAPREIPLYYERFSDVSRFMQDLNQRFSRWYNQIHKGFGHVWAERFTSVLLVSTQALRACMIYVELNALRAGIVREPEKYQYCGLYSLTLGGRQSLWLDRALLKEAVDTWEVNDSRAEGRKAMDPISRYLAMVYKEGLNLRRGKAAISEEIWESKMQELPEEIKASAYMAHLPLMTKGLIIGSKKACEWYFAENNGFFRTDRRREATPLIKDKVDERDSEGEAGTRKEPKSLGHATLSDLYSIRSYSMSPTPMR